jgi:ABC-2 type transport system ATP-binding protein
MVDERVSDEGKEALAAHGLWKSYRRGSWALAGVDLSVGQGAFTALVGPNAAGKSTLMRTWVGFERPSRGSVSVDDADPWRDRRRALRQIAYVPQSPTLYDALSVAEHLEMAGILRPGFDASLAMDRLASLKIPLTSRGRQLSGGQAAQVSLALALGTRAQILILDEPLASLDPLARREFLHIVRAEVAAGRTAVLSSHVVSDVEEACNHIVLLGVGRVLLDATIIDAKNAHSVWSGDPNQGVVGTFAGPSGESLHLVKLSPDGRASGGRPATLEEIVLGYLAGHRASEPTETAP